MFEILLDYLPRNIIENINSPFYNCLLYTDISFEEKKETIKRLKGGIRSYLMWVKENRKKTSHIFMILIVNTIIIP
jgi:hypothetical protein